MKTIIPLEDAWSDVIGKARRGLGISEEELAKRSGLSIVSTLSLEKGLLDLTQLGAVAEPLGLDLKSLLALARGDYHPGLLELPSGLAMFTSPWHDFNVHAYLLWDPDAGERPPTASFDTGSDASEMLAFVKKNSLVLGQIFLTHGHGDHVFELDRLVERSGATAWIGEGEEVPGAVNFPSGREFSVGSLRIETRSTWGHARGGITYVIHGLKRPVAIIGDALFAGSMGGAVISYAACLETNQREILSLPPDTLLCPGHGPVTNVALEKANNPFFA